MLYGYRQFHCIYKNRWYLQIYCRRCWNFKDIDTSNYELDRPLPKEKNKKVIGLMKEELGGKIIIEVVGLRVQFYSYLITDGSEDKKPKGKKSVS